jgi:hypothetical protein
MNRTPVHTSSGKTHHMNLARLTILATTVALCGCWAADPPKPMSAEMIHERVQRLHDGFTAAG